MVTQDLIQNQKSTSKYKDFEDLKLLAEEELEEELEGEEEAEKEV